MPPRLIKDENDDPPKKRTGRDASLRLPTLNAKRGAVKNTYLGLSCSLCISHAENYLRPLSSFLSGYKARSFYTSRHFLGAEIYSREGAIEKLLSCLLALSPRPEANLNAMVFSVFADKRKNICPEFY